MVLPLTFVMVEPMKDAPATSMAGGTPTRVTVVLEVELLRTCTVPEKEVLRRAPAPLMPLEVMLLPGLNTRVSPTLTPPVSSSAAATLATRV